MGDLKFLRFWENSVCWALFDFLSELIANSICWALLLGLVFRTYCKYFTLLSFLPGPVLKLTFRMKVINCLSYSWGSLLITERSEHHKGSAGQWVIMDQHNHQQRIPLCIQNFFSQFTKSVGESSRAEAVPCRYSRKGEEKVQESSASLLFSFRGTFFPTSLWAGENPAGSGYVAPPWTEASLSPHLLLQTGVKRVTSTFNNGWNKALIIFLQSPDYISVSKTRQIKRISAKSCGQIHLQNFGIRLTSVHQRMKRINWTYTERFFPLVCAAHPPIPLTK